MCACRHRCSHFRRIECTQRCSSIVHRTAACRPHPTCILWVTFRVTMFRLYSPATTSHSPCSPTSPSPSLCVVSSENISSGLSRLVVVVDLVLSCERGSRSREGRVRVRTEHFRKHCTVHTLQRNQSKKHQKNTTHTHTHMYTHNIILHTHSPEVPCSLYRGKKSRTIEGPPHRWAQMHRWIIPDPVCLGVCHFHVDVDDVGVYTWSTRTKSILSLLHLSLSHIQIHTPTFTHTHTHTHTC
jgi:hypothetical protein